ncbi:putative reverse transcriptase domain-containing protein [Tanacetum coccineum]
MRQRRWIELFSYYDCEIRYHPALRLRYWKLRVKHPRSSILRQKGCEDLRSSLKGKKTTDCILLNEYGNLRTLIMNEVYTTKYSIHPGADKMYYDLRDLYWWPGMKKDISIIIWKEVSPRKGVVRFGKRSKLSPRYVGPFEIVERVGPVAYRLRLPQELVGVHDTFHVSNLKKCLADVNLDVPLEEIKIDDKLHFVEKPMGIMDREVNKLKKKSRIPIVKVCWNPRRGPELTWEREDEMKRKYP